MKTKLKVTDSKSAYALLMVMFFSGISLLALASAMKWTSNNAILTRKNNAYFEAVAAAEAATEKVLSNVSKDFQGDGESLVYSRMDAYRVAVPTTTESSYWSGWTFSDAQGNNNKVYVQRSQSWQWTDLSSQYTGLKGMASTYRIVANAVRVGSIDQVTGAVAQDLQVANIPVFQFAIFYGMLMEISCGQPFIVTGRVHSNKDLYVCPDSDLTFNTHVTAVGGINFGRAPGDARGAPAGTVTYKGEKDAKVASLTLPIGTNNTPDAVHAILEVPPGTEDINSLMGKQRYFNKADLILVVSNNTVSAKSGSYNSFATAIPSSQVNTFVTTNTSFNDARESKTVYPIDVDIGKLKTWSETNTVLRSSLTRDVRSVYVQDARTMSGTKLKAVRVKNGATLPSLGLTVATEDPLYVLGDYNAPVVAQRGTTYTTSTVPASLLGDAITVLSGSWTDSNSTASESSRVASSTTINAAFLAGIVETATAGSYSGGVENFPRFLEEWGSSKIFTYNGSMVVLFPSEYATTKWGQSNVYGPPKRNWAFDLNFMDPTKLPPGTPEMRTMIRGQWALVQKNTVTY